MIKKKIEVDPESSFQFECVDGERCQSYNFGTVNQEIFKCKLCDSDRFVGFADLTEDKNLIHRGMMVSQICLSA